MATLAYALRPRVPAGASGTARLAVICSSGALFTNQSAGIKPAIHQRSALHTSARCQKEEAACRPVAAAGKTAPPSDTSLQPLTWTEYLSLRASRRRWGSVTTYPLTAVALLTSGQFFLTATIDPSTPGFAGIDPVYLSILGTAACGGLGYLVGPALGNGLWAVVYRAKRKETERMDNEFWKHVVRNRADALGQTMQNRLPDFYAESVTSLSTYRQWLRDQSAFKRKLQHGVEEAQREEQRRAGRSGL